MPLKIQHGNISLLLGVLRVFIFHINCPCGWDQVYQIYICSNWVLLQFPLFCFWEEWGRIELCILGWPRPHCTARVDLELATTFLLSLLCAGITSMNYHDQHSCLLLSYLWNAIKTRIYSYLMCKGILPLCLCTTCTYCLGRPEKGIRASETGVTYDWQLPYKLRFYRRSYTRVTRTLNL